MSTEAVPSPWTDRHPSVAHFEPFFAYAHLSDGNLQRVSQRFAALAEAMLDSLDDGPELSACLRKLVEAKDCAVRQAVLDLKAAGQAPGANRPGQ